VVARIVSLTEDAHPIPQAVLVEVAAGVAIARKNRPCSLVLRLSCDASGSVRLRVEGVEGVSLQALVALDKGPTMKGT
jgi:hypothetical protein